MDTISAESRSALAVFRVRSEHDPDGNIRMRAAEFASGYLAHKYNFLGALTAVFPQVNLSRRSSKVFCSQLVANAYKQAGLDLFGRRPTKIVPGDFALLASNSIDSFLEDVTTKAVVQRDPLLAESEGVASTKWVTSQNQIFQRVTDDPAVKRHVWELRTSSIWNLLYLLDETHDLTLDHRIADILDLNKFSGILDLMEVESGDVDVARTADSYKSKYSDAERPIIHELMSLSEKIAMLTVLYVNAVTKLGEFEETLKVWPESRTFKTFRDNRVKHLSLLTADISRLKLLYEKLVTES